MLSIISMARIFGAPETVPAGKVALKPSMLFIPSFKVPVTLETSLGRWDVERMVEQIVTVYENVEAGRAPREMVGAGR